MLLTACLGPGHRKARFYLPNNYGNNAALPSLWPLFSGFFVSSYSVRFEGRGEGARECSFSNFFSRF